MHSLVARTPEKPISKRKAAAQRKFREDKVVLRVLEKRGARSEVGIARALGLEPVDIKGIVARLLKHGVIESKLRRGVLLYSLTGGGLLVAFMDYGPEHRATLLGMQMKCLMRKEERKRRH